MGTVRHRAPKICNVTIFMNGRLYQTDEGFTKSEKRRKEEKWRQKLEEKKQKIAEKEEFKRVDVRKFIKIKSVVLQ